MKHQLPARIWQRWEFGELGGRTEFWTYLERLLGAEEVDRLLRGEAERVREVA